MKHKINYSNDDKVTKEMLRLMTDALGSKSKHKAYLKKYH